MNTEHVCGRVAATLLLVTASFLAAGHARGQEGTANATTPSVDQKASAGDASPPDETERGFASWTEFAGPYATFRWGFSGMYDVATYSQDEKSKEQVGELDATGKWRDFRLVFSGRFPKVPWLTWKAGVMFDGPSQTWLVRESGLIFEVPHGTIFGGRTKEGFSMVKHMVGTSIWGLERSPFLDGGIPIMADGVRWMGYTPSNNFVWNLAAYNEKFSQSRHAPYFDRQAVTRFAWLPLSVQQKGDMLHLGMNIRYADPQDDKLQFKARPESITAPYFLDTGSFPAKHTTTIGPEIYYRHGNILAGTEYYFEKVNSHETNDPMFQGGDVLMTWLITGESRAYKTKGGGLWDYVHPDESVFKGGKGAWEATFRFSYTDADGGTIKGGKLWRVSPLISWLMSDNMRLTAAYGYGVLDRFDKKGATQFFQGRVHVMF